MGTPYRRRRPSIVRNLWVYRHLVAVAFLLGVLLWFVLSNRDPVRVWLPFKLGSYESSSGVVILVSALAGSVVTFLALGTISLTRRLKSGPAAVDGEDGEVFLDDRPPSDYASKASEGFDFDGPK